MRKLPYNPDKLTWIDRNHTRNAEKTYCYCGKDLDQDEPDIQCQGCKQMFHGRCIQCLPKPLLFGDNFLQFRCDICTSGSESYERENMSWIAVVHLVLYNLIRRREIANKRTESPTVDHKYFRWKDDICAFVDDYWDYLVPKRKRSPTWHNTIASVLSTHGSVFKSGFEVFHQTAWWTLHTEEPPSKGKQEKATTTRKSQKRDCGKNDSNEEPGPKKRKTGVQGASEAYTRQPQAKRDISPSLPPSRSPSAIDANALSNKEISEAEDDLLGYGSLSDLSDTESILAETVVSDNEGIKDENTVVTATQTSSTTDDISKEEAAANQTTTVRKEPEEVKIPGTIMSVVEPAPERLSQQEEWQIHQKLSNSSKTLPVAAKRLERKLALRRSKRSFGLRLFDIDHIITQHLRQKDGVRATSPTIADIDKTPSKAEIDEEEKKKSTFSGIFTPYICSFASRVYGSPRNRITITKDEPWLSAWNGRKLRPYIRRDFRSRPPMMQILQQVVSRRITDTQQQASVHSIDYVYFQPEHLSQVNNMLRRCFWEGIDVSESLLFPEYSIVALYKRLVVGCAFMTPEAYITYIAVLPGWENAGIGQFMLYHLFQTAISKDITLHVSANNRAMLLYQKFGFKPEEFIVNFYDKYLPADSLSSKNAFLLRLRR